MNHSEDPVAGIRIGHAEREAVIDTLRDAAADGRLTLDELDERIGRAAEARVFGDLDALVADLPVPRPSDRLRPFSAPRRTRAPRPAIRGQSSDDRLVLRCTWASVQQSGRWEVPPFIRVEPALSTAVLDFTDVETDLEVIDIEISGGAGSTELIVPRSWGVDTGSLAKGWGSITSRVPGTAERGRPLIVVHGSVGLGSFIARHPDYLELSRRNTAH